MLPYVQCDVLWGFNFPIWCVHSLTNVLSILVLSFQISVIFTEQSPGYTKRLLAVYQLLDSIVSWVLAECHYSDPAVAACIRRAAERARPLLARGAPALAVQPLEPLTVPSIRLRQHNAPHNHFKYDAWLSDVVLHGLTKYDFNKLE